MTHLHIVSKDDWGEGGGCILIACIPFNKSVFELVQKSRARLNTDSVQVAITFMSDIP